MLYWAEGDKCRNSVRISTSDPEVLVFFAKFLREHFDVANAKMLIACNLFADHLEHLREIERYWLARVALPSSSLRKSMVNVYSKYSKKTRTNRPALRNLQARCPQHAHRPDDLRVDAGVRMLRAS